MPISDSQRAVVWLMQVKSVRTGSDPGLVFVKPYKLMFGMTRQNPLWLRLTYKSCWYMGGHQMFTKCPQLGVQTGSKHFLEASFDADLETAGMTWGSWRAAKPSAASHFGFPGDLQMETDKLCYITTDKLCRSNVLRHFGWMVAALSLISRYGAHFHLQNEGTKRI